MYRVQPTEEEARHLAYSAEIDALTKMAGWKHVNGLLNLMLAEAVKRLSSSLSSDPHVALAEKIGLQRTEYVIQQLRQHIDSTLAQRKALIIELTGDPSEEMNGNDSGNSLP